MSRAAFSRLRRTSRASRSRRVRSRKSCFVSWVRDLFFPLSDTCGCWVCRPQSLRQCGHKNCPRSFHRAACTQMTRMRAGQPRKPLCACWAFPGLMQVLGAQTPRRQTASERARKHHRQRARRTPFCDRQRTLTCLLVPAQAQLHRNSIFPSVGRAVLSVLENKRDKKGTFLLQNHQSRSFWVE
jgi:hypothetical protein